MSVCLVGNYRFFFLLLDAWFIAHLETLGDCKLSCISERRHHLFQVPNHTFPRPPWPFERQQSTKSKSQSPICAKPLNDLQKFNPVVGNGQLGSTGERLSAGLHSLQVLVVGQTLVLDEVIEEVQQVTTEVSNGRLGDEAVDSHLTVRTDPDIPLDTVEGDRSDALAGRGDGAGTTQGSKPHHDLVLLAAGRSRTEEQVVRDIGDDVGVGVAIPEIVSGVVHSEGTCVTTCTGGSKKDLPPGPGGLEALNSAQDLRSERERGIGVALDLVR